MSKIKTISLLSIVLMGLALAQTSQAQQSLSGDRKLARLMYSRITGVLLPTDSIVLDNMEALIKSGRRFDAAKIATDADEFYNETVRNMASTMANRDQAIDIRFNDFIAMFVGVTRDRANAKELLTGDYFYIGDTSKYPLGRATSDDIVLDILKSNQHYLSMDSSSAGTGVSALNLRSILKKSPQFVVNRAGLAVIHPEPAGLLTTRTWGFEHLRAGTNRRAVQFSFSQFLCMNIDEFRDAGATIDPAANGTVTNYTDPVTTTTFSEKTMISQDVTRSPQGDSLVFRNKCKSCHNMLDYMRPAFAHFDFNDVAQTPFYRNTLVLDFNTNVGGDPNPNEIKVDAVTKLPQKYYSNATVFAGGHRLNSTKWYNNTVGGPKAAEFGWRGATTGEGLPEFAAMLANSRAFSSCLVSKVFEAVCKRPIDKATEGNLRDALVENFEQNNYRIKGIFEQVATRPECLGN